MSLAATMIQSVVQTQYVESVKEKYEEQIKELNSQCEEIAKSGHKDEFGYLIAGISKLTSMMLDCEQYDVSIDPDGEPILVDRVIKVNRYVNSTYLNLHGIDHVVLSGMFLVAPIYLLPANKVNAACKNRHHSVMNPTEYGLPNEQECHYGTIKQLNYNTYIALAKFKNNYINEIVNSVRGYDYVSLS